MFLFFKREVEEKVPIWNQTDADLALALATSDQLDHDWVCFSIIDCASPIWNVWDQKHSIFWTFSYLWNFAYIMKCLGDLIRLLDQLRFTAHAPYTHLLQRSCCIHVVTETSHESMCGIFNSVSRVHIQSLGMYRALRIWDSQNQELGAICSHFPIL